MARLSGFDTIPTTFPRCAGRQRGRDARRLELRQRVQDRSEPACGFTEVITYSFIHGRSCDRLHAGRPTTRGGRPSRCSTPWPRTSPSCAPRWCPGFWKRLRFNLAQQTRRLKIFEIGKVFLHRPGPICPTSRRSIAGLWSGSRASARPGTPRRPPCDFYDLKGAVERLLGALKLQAVAVRPRCRMQNVLTRARAIPAASCTGGRARSAASASCTRGVRTAFDLKQTALRCSSWTPRALEALVLRETRYRMRTPKFPAVTRDITLVVDRGLEAQAVLDAVAAMSLDLLESVQVVDVFDGEPVPAGKRSLSFRLTYRSPEQTLEDGEVNALHQDASPTGCWREFPAATLSRLKSRGGAADAAGADGSRRAVHERAFLILDSRRHPGQALLQDRGSQHASPGVPTHVAAVLGVRVPADRAPADATQASGSTPARRSSWSSRSRTCSTGAGSRSRARVSTCSRSAAETPCREPRSDSRRDPRRAARDPAPARVMRGTDRSPRLLAK
ncbi:MAG: hypothetical protein MZV70_07010 [Desulfobacterales bacterium]|nr:hypothetical protein [Desulfobacterales bacterium]